VAATLEGGVRPVTLDVTSQADVDAQAEKVGSEYGRLDVLVNNAGASKDDVRLAW
jgi:NAD(P)-dependent dehydrogenase (short-subunit alcohol dehydrogenase family)